MDLYYVLRFKKRWTSLTDYVDFCSVLHGLQIAEYSFSYHLAGGSLFYDENKLSSSSLLHALNAIRHNPQFFPETTIELGNTLEEYVENNNKELNVIMTR